ncbi:MAG: sxtJ [Gammaproteobacteria bacterium]|nr:MAG: sxtJ [Gammaproteobacteria bacterium]
MKTTHTQPTTRELREFGLIMAAGLIGLFGLLFPWWGDRPITLLSWPWIIGGAFAVAALLFPRMLGFLYKIWMKIGLVLGWINSRIILGLVFFVLFLPVSLFFKLTGKDPMARKLDKMTKTYRVNSKQPKPENLEKPF